MIRRSSSRRTSSGVLSTSITASGGTKAAAKEQEKIDAFFGQYADRSDDHCIGPEGVEALCNDLAVSPNDIQILLLAWRLRASRQGYFSLEEWRRGLKAMRVDTLDKLKKALPGLQHEITNQQTFKEFHTFAFQYCLTEPRQKTLDLETASQMVELVMGPRPHVALFGKFLEEQTEYKAMNLDQWTAFLRFCDEVQPDLNNYDESQAWPLLLDNFVDWVRKIRSTS